MHTFEAHLQIFALVPLPFYTWTTLLVDRFAEVLAQERSSSRMSNLNMFGRAKTGLTIKHPYHLSK